MQVNAAVLSSVLNSLTTYSSSSFRWILYSHNVLCFIKFSVQFIAHGVGFCGSNFGLSSQIGERLERILFFYAQDLNIFLLYMNLYLV